MQEFWRVIKYFNDNFKSNIYFISPHPAQGVMTDCVLKIQRSKSRETLLLVRVPVDPSPNPGTILINDSNTSIKRVGGKNDSILESNYVPSFSTRKKFFSRIPEVTIPE